jgi:LacI family transcriptional regulator
MAMPRGKLHRDLDRRTTMKDVAVRAGVSQTTVSFVMNRVSGPAISAETQERVWQAVRDLGYRPNATAKALRTRQTHSLGFVTDWLASSPFAGDIILGAQDEAWNRSHLLTIVNTKGDPAVEEAAVEELIARRVDGIVYASMAHLAVTPPRNLRDVPTVLINCVSTEPYWPSAVPDEILGGDLATSALVQAGHVRIGLINIAPDSVEPASVGRLAGYRDALARAAIPFDPAIVRDGNGNPDDGYRFTLELLEADNPPTALFCATDRTAMGAYDAIRSLGLRIPEDISVVGFDDQRIIAEFLRPALSTVALPFANLGRWAVQSLLDDHANGSEPTPTHHLIPCTYVERASVASPRMDRH